MKVKLDNLDPAALNSMRRKVQVTLRDGYAIVQSRSGPQKRPLDEKQLFHNALFGLAGRMTAWANDTDVEAAWGSVVDRHMVPRDFLTQAIWGTAFEIYNEDGSKWPLAPKLAVPENRIYVMGFFTGFDVPVRAASASGAAFATKGTAFESANPGKVSCLVAYLTTVSGGQYQAHWATLNASNKVVAIQSSPIQTWAFADLYTLFFPLEAVIVPWQRYAVLITRTNGPANYSLPLKFIANPWQNFPGQQIGHVQCLGNPAIGTTLTLNSTAALSTGFYGEIAT